MVEEESSPQASDVQSRMKEFMDSYMTGFIHFCIVANTFTMFVQLQWLGWLNNNALGDADLNGWPHAGSIFATFEYVFTIVFLIDLVMQIFVQRCHFFKSMINVFDLAIVVITGVEVFILAPLASSIGNVSAVRLMRLAKLVRVLKAVRTLKAFESLRILISTMVLCIASTFWSLIVLLIFQIMAAIFMCQSLHEFIVDESNEMDARRWVNDMYGDGLKSFWTIFELTFSGCWPNYARRIVQEVSPLYTIFFYVYVYIVVFVMTRIVAALFTKETFAQASQDAEMMVRARSQKTAFLKQKLSELFDEADVSGDDLLDLEEMRLLLDHPKVRLWMQELGVDLADADALFALLHDGSGGVTRAEFVSGITKLRGEARASDLLPVVSNMQRILGHVKSLRTSLDSLLMEKEAVRDQTQASGSKDHEEVDACWQDN